MIGLRKGKGGFFAFDRASLSNAQKPAHTGALQLVPPICSTWPCNTIRAPSSGSAVPLTSGTRRSFPAGTPGPFCHEGRLKKMLLPPPALGQALSEATSPVWRRNKLVPPTPITHGSDASYSACVGPVALCPLMSGFEP